MPSHAPPDSLKTRGRRRHDPEEVAGDRELLPHAAEPAEPVDLAVVDVGREARVHLVEPLVDLRLQPGDGARRDDGDVVRRPHRPALERLGAAAPAAAREEREGGQERDGGPCHGTGLPAQPSLRKRASRMPGIFPSSARAAGGHLAVHLDQHDRATAARLAAEAHAGDVDSVGAEHGAHPPHDARGVLVAHHQHVALRNGVDLDAVHVHEAQVPPAEDRPRHRQVLLARLEAEGHQVREADRGRGGGLEDLDLPLARDVHGVDQGQALGHVRPQDAGHRRGQDRLEVELAQVAVDAELDPLERAAAGLAEEEPEPLRRGPWPAGPCRRGRRPGSRS